MSSSEQLTPPADCNHKQTGPRWIWFITGPTACGKTTIAKAIADKLRFIFVEGDDYHPKTNLEKISRNQPLTDADRAAWLRALREHESAQPPDDAPSPHLVVTCSALKRQYRDLLREGGEPADDLRVRFVFLDVDEEVLRQRARERKGHFAGEGLVKSQMEALERPGGEEGDVLVVRVVMGKEVEETVGEVLRGVRGMMGIE